MIEIKITGNTIEEVTDKMARIMSSIGLAVKSDAKGTVGVTDTEDTPATKDDTPSVTLAEIKTLAKAKMEEQKSKAIKGLLADLGIKKIDQLGEDQYVDFYASLEGL